MLQILNAQVTDTGRYVCVAQNLAGTAEKSFNLHVHGESIMALFSDAGTAEVVLLFKSHLDFLYL